MRVFPASSSLGMLINMTIWYVRISWTYIFLYACMYNSIVYFSIPLFSFSPRGLTFHTHTCTYLIRQQFHLVLPSPHEVKKLSDSVCVHNMGSWAFFPPKLCYLIWVYLLWGGGGGIEAVPVISVWPLSLLIDVIRAMLCCFKVVGPQGGISGKNTVLIILACNCYLGF